MNIVHIIYIIIIWQQKTGGVVHLYPFTKNTYLRGSITVHPTSCLAALLMLNEQQFNLFGQIQTSQTGGQPYSDTSPCG